MNREELKEAIKDMLSIQTSVSYGYYGDKSIQISIMLDGEPIASDCFDLPKECSCNCNSSYY